MRSAEIRNSYEGLLEDWKVEMIVERARRKGIRPGELADVQQEVAIAILRFRFDPQKANGASEASAIRGLIDKRITHIQRGNARAKKRVERYQLLCMDSSTEPDNSEPVSLTMDVESVVATLPRGEKAVCEALARGESREATAKALGISRYEVEILLGQTRERFNNAGLAPVS
ncbi:MAG TPA: hypothetical protein VGP72_31745 [Planctomycetota bacterium]